MDMTLIWIALVILYLLLLALPLMFLCIGWETRRRNIVNGLTESAMKSYFRAFHPQLQVNPDKVKEQFEVFYAHEIGRRRFLWPFLLLAALLGLIFFWAAPSIHDLLQYESVDSGKLPALAILAIAGAYMWVLFDAIRRWYSSSISPAEIYWWSFRLVIAIPMGYAVKDIFSEDFSPALVFLLGALPTAELMSMAKRVASQKLKFTEADGTEISELQKLQGVDIRAAETFTAEGVNTMLQLAYCDPIRLTVRSGFNYSYVVDCTCQALLRIYVEDEIETYRKYGLRTAFEVLNLWRALKNPDTEAEAQLFIGQIAQALGRSEEAVENILGEVAQDSYTQFLYLSWSGLTEADMSASDREVFYLPPLNPL